MIPTTRAELQMMAPQKHERIRQEKVQEMVETIYANVLTTAEDPATTRLYRHLLKRSNEHGYRKYSDAFLETNMAEILDKVRALFPDCTVTHTELLTVLDHNGTQQFSEVPPVCNYPVNSPLIWISTFLIVDWSGRR